MRKPTISRREVLKASGAIVASSAFATRVIAAAPPASAATPALIEAAKKEGKAVWYTSVDLPLVAQLKPGDRVRFQVVSLAEARERVAARERALGLPKEPRVDRDRPFKELRVSGS